MGLHVVSLYDVDSKYLGAAALNASAYNTYNTYTRI